MQSQLAVVVVVVLLALVVLELVVSRGVGLLQLQLV
jgi:hypothetical protein